MLARAWQGRELFRPDEHLVVRAHIDVPAGPATLCFHGAEIWTLIPIWLRVVKVRQRIEPWGQTCFLPHEPVGDTNDGRRIHAATEFGKNWVVGTELSPHGFRK